MSEFTFTAFGRAFTLTEAIESYANIHRITQRDIKYRSGIGESLDNAHIELNGQRLTHQEALKLVFKLRSAISALETGNASLDRFCKTLVDVDVLLPRQVVRLVVAEVQRLEMEKMIKLTNYEVGQRVKLSKNVEGGIAEEIGKIIHVDENEDHFTVKCDPAFPGDDGIRKIPIEDGSEAEIL